MYVKLVDAVAHIFSHMTELLPGECRKDGDVDSGDESLQYGLRTRA